MKDPYERCQEWSESLKKAENTCNGEDLITASLISRGGKNLYAYTSARFTLFFSFGYFVFSPW